MITKKNNKKPFYTLSDHECRVLTQPSQLRDEIHANVLASIRVSWSKPSWGGGGGW